MHSYDYSSIEPYEICSIRPPTENASLTFRLTRNCPWNKCAFCPVYKLGAGFSRRTLDEVKEDVRRAKAIDDLLYVHGIGDGLGTGSEYRRAAELINRIRMMGGGARTEGAEALPRLQSGRLHPRMEWFLSWFKDSPTLEDSVYHVLQWRMGGGNTCFLGDADSMILDPGFLGEAISYIKIHFPTLTRFTVYGRTKTVVKRRSVKDLAGYAKAGLHRVHFGMESGSDAVLELVRKGVTADEHVEACRMVRDAGMSPSVYVMPGLGGAALSEKHARETAATLTKCRPDFIRLRSLEIFPHTGLDEMEKRGEFIQATEEQVAREIRVLVEEIGCECEILSDSASNLMEVYGRLPEDRAAMLSMIDAYLEISPRQKLEYSLESRLGHFLGQYGRPSDDVVDILRPMLSGDNLVLSRASDDQLRAAIKLIRGKLMP
ncbi:MAG: radical SAM protein [Spirochaetes bacterium]|nr:radical SAM protein [Spirochaetota bacterium]